MSTLSLLAVFMLNMGAYSQVLLSGNNFIPTEENLLHPPPVPYFFITGLCFGDTTHFINKTSSNTISSEWSILNDKGDTVYSSKNKNISYYFKKRGFYNICLTAYNGHIAKKIRTVKIDTITKAEFAFRYCYDKFDNLSSCSDQFIWVLPDNTVSTDSTPVYKFSAPGNYPVKLISRRGSKSDTLFKFINVRGDSVGVPNAAFTFKRVDTSSTFEFTAVDSLAHRYSWYFGDLTGDTSGFKVVHHIDKSIYTPPVNLFVTNGCGVSVDMLDPFTVTAIPQEKKTTFDAMIYPNPAIQELTVTISNLDINKLIILRLIDANGSIIKETKSRSIAKTFNFTYTLGQLPKGIYLLQVAAEEQLLNKKFIVQ